MKTAPRNVTIFHSQGGIGRPGLVICCYMIYAGVVSSPEEAFHRYTWQRTKGNGAALSPAQITYVRYLHAYLEDTKTK